MGKMGFLLGTAAAAALTLSACSGSEEASEEASVDTAVAGDAAEAGATPAAGTATSAGTLDANSATAEQLTGAGVSAEVAQAIVAGRPYATVVDLKTKLQETLSPEAADAALQNVFVPVNLNSASEAEIRLIPGMTDRMVGEFLEYRPYENLEEFDREIGKYVDAAEVARFRRYVTL